MQIEQNTWIMNKAELGALVRVAGGPHAVVHFDARKRAVAATDGHRLTRCRVADKPGDADPAVIPVAPLADITKRAKKSDRISVRLSGSTATVTITSSGGVLTSEIPLANTPFPPLDQVVPRDPDGREAAATVGLDAEYLSAILDMQRAAGAESVRLHAGSQHDPIMFVAENPERGNIWEHVLMPFRL